LRRDDLLAVLQDRHELGCNLGIFGRQIGKCSALATGTLYNRLVMRVKIEVETHSCTTDAMDIVFAIIWKVVVLRMPISLDATQLKGNTHDDISDILDVYNDEARTASAIRQHAIDNRTHEWSRTAKEKTSTITTQAEPKQ
jgi:hypothetical protein